jgi:hypothetical protein
MLPLIRKLFATKALVSHRRRPHQIRPALEALEARVVPTSLTYGGGPLLTNVEVSSVYFGPDWSTNPTYQKYTGTLNSFLRGVVNSFYLDQLAEYSVPGQAIRRGSFTGPDVTSNGWSTATTSLGGTTYTTINDSTIRGMLNSEIASGQLTTPDANSLYVVYVAPNVAVINDSSIDTLKGRYDNSAQDFVGYHLSGTDTNGNTYYYAVIVDPSGYQGFTPKGAPKGLTPVQ